MESTKLTIFLLLFCIMFENYAFPMDSSTQSLVIDSLESPTKDENSNVNVSSTMDAGVPKIYQMYIKSEVSNRFANTTVSSRVKNVSNKSEEASFTVILPETAFISGFIMEVNGKNYTAHVKEKEEAKKNYDEAVASGLGAAHVAVSARDSNRFTVSVNIEPESKAAFYLNYEELLKRQDGHYELVINLHPGQPVKNLEVEVVIKERRKIVHLKAPPIRSGNEIGNEKSELDPRADINVINDTAAVIKFTPNIERQKQLAQLLGTSENEGLAGQFVVQYDVKRDPEGGEILVQDGYFVHFFAPSEVLPLPKHVVFILDTSYSMFGQKIEQLREAMIEILGELKENDLFNLVEFSTNIKVWDLDNVNGSVYFPNNDDDGWNTQEMDEDDISNYTFPNAYPANVDNIKKAKATAMELQPNGGTNIYSALMVGLHLIQLAKNKIKSDNNPQPIIIFLTDGDPTVGVTSSDEIVAKISELNFGSRTSPIFALSFGDEADKVFLQKLALRNSGFSRHIYEAADASLQLQDFYRQISSPLLANVTFKYEPTATSLTKTDFPIHFGGSELVVAGWCGTDRLNPVVDGWGIHGEIHFKPTTEHSVSNVERLWAYLTIKQLLDKKETSDEDKEMIKKKALDLALKYSFVTPVSSLVVVKPNDTNAVDTVVAEKARFLPYAQSLGAPAGVPLSGTNGLITLKSGDYFSAPEENAFEEYLFEDYEFENLTTEETPNTTERPDILTKVPWLNNVISENGTLKLPSGEYKLGLNVTLTDAINCPNAPNNSTGHCSLLNACEKVHSLLISLDILIQYFCPYKTEYVGVCCPI